MTPADLRALAARVEAGEECGYAIDCAVTWPEASPPVGAQHAIRSLDACAALHEAVLEDRWGDCALELVNVSGPWRARMYWLAVRPMASVHGCAPSLARAWLAAILRAMAAEKEAQ